MSSIQSSNIRLKKISSIYHRRWSCQDSPPARARDFSQHVDNICNSIMKFCTPKSNGRGKSVRHSMQLKSPLNTRNAGKHMKSANSQGVSNFQHTRVSKNTFMFQPTVSWLSQIPNNKCFPPSNSLRAPSGFLLRLEDKNKKLMETEEGKYSLQQIQDSKSKVVRDKISQFRLKSVIAKNHEITKKVLKDYERDKISTAKNNLPKSNYFKQITILGEKGKRCNRVLYEIRLNNKFKRNSEIERFLTENQNKQFDSHSESDESQTQIQIQKVDIGIYGIEVLPNGLKQFKRYDKILLTGKTPFEVAKISKDHRTPNDNLFISHYLFQDVKFFSSMNITLVAFISRKVTSDKFSKDQVIIRKGDMADCMYIIYKGQVEVIIEGRVGEPIMISACQVFGQTALQNRDPRNATCIARSNVECIILSKIDYDSVVFETKKMQKMINLKFLLSLDFFSKWSGPNIEKINRDFEILECKPNEVVYSAKEEANVFYIVKSGYLYMESVVDLEDSYRIPVGTKSWEIRKTTRTISYRVKEFVPGDMFGHEEIYDKCKRKCSVISGNESEILYMNLNEFNKYFLNKYAEERLFANFPRVHDEDIKSKIYENDLIRKLNSDAIFKACNLNFSQASSRNYYPEDRKIKKLSFYLDKAKKKMCLTKNEQEEKNKIKLIEIKNQFFNIYI